MAAKQDPPSINSNARASGGLGRRKLSYCDERRRPLGNPPFTRKTLNCCRTAPIPPTSRNCHDYLIGIRPFEGICTRAQGRTIRAEGSVRLTPQKKPKPCSPLHPLLGHKRSRYISNTHRRRGIEFLQRRIYTANIASQRYFRHQCHCSGCGERTDTCR